MQEERVVLMVEGESVNYLLALFEEGELGGVIVKMRGEGDLVGIEAIARRRIPVVVIVPRGAEFGKLVSERSISGFTAVFNGSDEEKDLFARQMLKVKMENK